MYKPGDVVVLRCLDRGDMLIAVVKHDLQTKSSIMSFLILSTVDHDTTYCMYNTDKGLLYGFATHIHDIALIKRQEL